MTIISLLTDFGEHDGYVGVMKAVICGICPQAVQFIDICHTIKPQDVMEGTLVLSRAAPYFPAGTIHLAVVDPGVGTQRRPLAARLGEHYFVGPDNGLITGLLDQAKRQQAALEFVHLDRPQYWLPDTSTVFHGRDIFAPVAAHLAAGVPLAQLGTPISSPRQIEIPRPRPLDRGWRGQVIHIDHFGSLETNLGRNYLQAFTRPQVRFGERTIDGLSKTFGDGEPGDLLALIDSNNHLALSVVNGSAAEMLHARIGDPVDIVIPRQTIFKDIEELVEKDLKLDLGLKGDGGEE